MHYSDMEDEMRHHLAARAADLERQGVPADEALRQAHLEFGSMVRYQEEAREALGLRLFDKTRADLRVTFRSLKNSPVFTLVAVLTLALGIGANTLVFSIVNGVLWKPLPYSGAGRIYSIRTVVPKMAQVYPDLPVNGRHAAEWRQVCTSCENVALLGVTAFNLEGAGDAQRLQGLKASADLFPLLGVHMQLGRAYTGAEDQPGSDRVAVISDELWRRAFSADPSVIGRKFLFNQIPREVIGVLPAGFSFPRGEQMGAILRLPDRVDVLVPVGLDLLKIKPAGMFNYGALVKLRPGSSPSQAIAEMNRPLADFAQEAQQQMFARLLPLKQQMTREVRRPLWLLFGAAAALLLIVCVNLGNLLMTRAAGRQRDSAIRMAIGATRADLFRYALAESLMLASAGGAVGLWLAWSGLQLLSRLAPETLPRLEQVHFDWPVLFVSFFLSVSAGVLCSLAPVWRMLRSDPQQTLGATSLRATESRGERRARRALISFEAALSMALAAAAGLLIISFTRVMSAERGFDTEHVLTFQLALPEGRYSMDRRIQFHAEVLDKLASMHGVVAVGLTSHLPLQGETWVSQVRRKGDSRHFNDVPQANYRFISPDYFRAVGTPILSGRSIEFADRDRKVIVISERVARKIFPNENPIGQMIHYNDERSANLLEVIGVVADVKTTGLEKEPPLIVYVPYWQAAQPGASYVLRAAGDETALIAGVRHVVASIDRGLPVHQIRTMTQIVGTAVATRRLQLLLATGFALTGILLACLGVFGVVSYGVSRRTGEIGVRMALGATRKQILSMVLREAMWPVITGLLGGLLCALAFGRLLASQLYGVSPRDPFVLTAIALSIAVAALTASYWPARRAASIEPVQALRWE